MGARVVHEEVRSAHMRDVHLRRVLEHSLGTDTHLVVAKFANYGAIIREQSIPAAALAVKRFQVGVLASTSDWFGAGLLSEVHAAMLLEELPSDVESVIGEGMARFAFSDPYSDAGMVDLHATTVTLDLAGFAIVEDLFHGIAERLVDAARELPHAWNTPDRSDRW